MSRALLVVAFAALAVWAILPAVLLLMIKG